VGEELFDADEGTDDKRADMMKLIVDFFILNFANASTPLIQLMKNGVHMKLKRNPQKFT
jgi:hypothetical protein